MRLNAFALTALLPVAGLLSGCAMGTQGVNSVAAATPAVKTIRGKAHGGQQAVSNGQIVVYQYGATGYGSTGTVIATATTDQNGNFNVPYTCTDANAPVYVLSIGGNPGPNAPANAAIVLGAGLGTCGASEDTFVSINEISTTVLGFALSHFFSTTDTTDPYTPDHFGSPASLTPAISRVNSVLIPTITDVPNGYPQPTTSTFLNESAKIITVADILGACVNSFAPDSPSCLALFGNTQIGNSTPTNTLEAAVNIALAPSQNVGNLYSLVPPSGSSAFAGSLTTQPNDWTLAVGYIDPSLGLGVDPTTLTTLDIDNSGRVWFPTNVPGSAGVANFDPASGTFSQAFTAAGLVHPEQVAIDINGKVWVTDSESNVIAGFPAVNPGNPTILSQSEPTLITTALTVLDDDSLAYAVYDTGSNIPAFAKVSADNTTYTLIPNTTPPGSQGYGGTSLAGDAVGGAGASASDSFTPNVYDLYITPSGTENYVTFSAFANAGQVAFTGNDFVSPRGGFNGPADGLCIYSQQNCFAFNDQSANHHPSGIVVDGGGNLWMSDLYTADVQQVLLTNGSYLNSGGLVGNTTFSHNVNNGGTLVAPGGIAVDNTGNVWVSNQGCVTRACTPSQFILTEIVGLAIPAVTPISAQVVLNNNGPGTEPQAKKATTKAK